LLGLLVGFQILDGLLTYAFVSRRLVQELNPFIIALTQHGSFTILKICGALVCALLLWLVSRRFRHLALITTSAMTIFYAVVLGWNLQVLVRLS